MDAPASRIIAIFKYIIAIIYNSPHILPEILSPRVCSITIGLDQNVTSSRRLRRRFTNGFSCGTALLIVTQWFSISFSRPCFLSGLLIFWRSANLVLLDLPLAMVPFLDLFEGWMWIIFEELWWWNKTEHPGKRAYYDISNLALYGSGRTNSESKSIILQTICMLVCVAW